MEEGWIMQLHYLVGGLSSNTSIVAVAFVIEVDQWEGKEEVASFRKKQFNRAEEIQEERWVVCNEAERFHKKKFDLIFLLQNV